MAITKFDQFDFLIDIVPRDELKPVSHQSSGKRNDDVGTRTAAMLPDQVQYYFNLAQQTQQALQQQQQQTQPSTHASSSVIIDPLSKWMKIHWALWKFVLIVMQMTKLHDKKQLHSCLGGGLAT